MDTKHFGLRAVLGLALSLGAIGCADDGSGSDGSDETPAGDRPGGAGGSDDGSGKGALDIVDTAASAGTFNTLAMAIGSAGLEEALRGEGPFTVFAPTDAAFAKLPDGLVASLSQDELADILAYHVIAGDVRAADLTAAPVSMLSGISAFISLEGSPKINGANITMADIEAENGVIHVIDTVILPPNLVEAAQLAGSFTTLVSAVVDAELVDALSGEGPLTVFAPTDDAFAALPDGTLENMDKPTLQSVLTYHVVSGEVLSTDLKNGAVATLEGQDVTIDLAQGVKVNDATVVVADIVTTNGVIHVIDKVLVPQL